MRLFLIVVLSLTNCRIGYAPTAVSSLKPLNPLTAVEQNLAGQILTVINRHADCAAAALGRDELQMTGEASHHWLTVWYRKTAIVFVLIPKDRNQFPSEADDTARTVNRVITELRQIAARRRLTRRR